MPRLPTFLRAGIAVAFGVVAGAPSPVVGQDGCPAASALDAEAGWAAYRAGDVSGSRDRFLRALARCGNDDYARTGLAYVTLREGDADEAAGLFGTVLESDPTNVDALVGLGLVAWRDGDLDAVRSRFGRVLEVAPDHPTAADYMERVRRAEAAASGAPDPAEEAWARGDLDRALELYSARLEQDPTDGLALLRLGQMRSWRGEYGEALRLFDRLVERQPDNVDARVARARAIGWSGDVPRAIEEIEEALAIEPRSVAALVALATFQSSGGDGEAALATYEALLSIAPEHAEARRGRARARALARQADTSIAAYRRILEGDPDDREARIGLASSLALASEWDASVDAWDEILRRDPGEMRALTGRARTLLWAGRLVRAERAALRAIEADDTNAAAWGMLAQVYRAQGRDAAALATLDTGLGFDPLDTELQEQHLAVRTTLAPDVRPSVRGEDDSDGNRMVTTDVSASWHPRPRLEVRTRVYHKRLEQVTPAFRLERAALGASVAGAYQLRPGWVVTGGVGGSGSDGTGRPRFLSLRAEVRTPDRYPFGATLSLSTQGIDDTALLAERGVRATGAVLAGRWFPGPEWRLDGSVGLGSWDGSEPNGRREWSAAVSRSLGAFHLGVSHRGFSFEKNLNDGYFDPDYYGIVELTSWWRGVRGRWSLLVEAAPGVQQVRTDGDPTGSIRATARAGWAVAPSRELSLTFGYSNAGLSSFATGGDDYEYFALVLGLGWVF